MDTNINLSLWDRLLNVRIRFVNKTLLRKTAVTHDDSTNLEIRGLGPLTVFDVYSTHLYWIIRESLPRKLFTVG
jgi:hypothetical protein